MANNVRGQIAAEFKGAAIKLALSTNAICELEDAADRPITAILDEVASPDLRRMKTLRLIFWAMMLDEKPDATIKDASDLIDGLRGKEVQIMTDAVNAAFPDVDPDQEGTAPEK